MNCRELERIMPELASGEIDEKTAAQAHEHIASCPSCASEYAGYEAAMSALAGPHESFECPPELDQLYLPERKPFWAWARPVFVTAALAAVLAGIVFIPRQPAQMTAPQMAVNPPETKVVAPEKRTSSPNVGLSAKTEIATREDVHIRKTTRHKSLHTMVATAKTGGSTLRESVTHFGLERNKEWFFHDTLTDRSAVPAPAPRPASTPAARAVDSAKVLGEADSELGIDKDEDASIIVMACDFDESPALGGASSGLAEPVVVHVESTDESNGNTTVFIYTRDNEGNEQVIETTSTKHMGT